MMNASLFEQYQTRLDEALSKADFTTALKIREFLQPYGQPPKLPIECLGACGKVAIRCCSVAGEQCSGVYCSKVCQKKHHKKHKKICAKRSQLRQGYGTSDMLGASMALKEAWKTDKGQLEAAILFKKAAANASIPQQKRDQMFVELTGVDLEIIKDFRAMHNTKEAQEEQRQEKQLFLNNLGGAIQELRTTAISPTAAAAAAVSAVDKDQTVLPPSIESAEQKSEQVMLNLPE